MEGVFSSLAALPSSADSDSWITSCLSFKNAASSCLRIFRKDTAPGFGSLVGLSTGTIAETNSSEAPAFNTFVRASYATDSLVGDPLCLRAIMLSFRDIETTQLEDVEHLVRWANDLEIRHLFQQFDSEKQSQERLALDAPQLQRMITRAIKRGKVVQLIEWQAQVVGELTIEMNPRMLIDPRPHTAWLGIVIGAESARGRGLGRLAMEHIEKLAKILGAKHAQIGVFEFNTRARRLYETLGYKEITTLSDFTWWKGKRWSDIRMGKPL